MNLYLVSVVNGSRLPDEIDVYVVASCPDSAESLALSKARKLPGSFSYVKKIIKIATEKDRYTPFLSLIIENECKQKTAE